MSVLSFRCASSVDSRGPQSPPSPLSSFTWQMLGAGFFQSPSVRFREPPFKIPSPQASEAARGGICLVYPWCTGAARGSPRCRVCGYSKSCPSLGAAQQRAALRGSAPGFAALDAGLRETRSVPHGSGWEWFLEMAEVMLAFHSGREAR